MSDAKKKETKTPEAVELVKSTTAIEVVDKPKSVKLEKGSQEAKDKMAEVRAGRTPECFERGAEKRQKTQAFKNAMQKALSVKYDGVPIGNVAREIWGKYKDNGLDTFLDAMSIAICVKAANGDVEAAKYARDTMGEKPVEETEHSGNITITLASNLKEYAE